MIMFYKASSNKDLSEIACVHWHHLSFKTFFESLFLCPYYSLTVSLILYHTQYVFSLGSSFLSQALSSRPRAHPHIHFHPKPEYDKRHGKADQEAGPGREKADDGDFPVEVAVIAQDQRGDAEDQKG